MKSATLAVLFVGLLVMIQSIAGAEILTDSGQVAFSARNEQQYIYLDNFNVAGAHLNSVHVTFWDSGGADLSVTTGATQVNSIFGTVRRSYNVSGPEGVGAFNNTYTIDGTVWENIAPNQNNLLLETVSFSNATAESFTIDSSEWEHYQGEGTFWIAVATPNTGTAFANSVTADGTNYSAAWTNSNLHVGVTVTYDYAMDNPGVPEPSSLALLPMALGGLVLWRRRRTPVL